MTSCHSGCSSAHANKLGSHFISGCIKFDLSDSHYPASWEMALEHCFNEGGRLAEIHTEEQMMALHLYGGLNDKNKGFLL